MSISLRKVDIIEKYNNPYAHVRTLIIANADHAGSDSWGDICDID